MGRHPSVADAEQRARALALSQHSRDRGDPVPRRFAAALVATEDSRFFRHHGIDSIGVGRAVLGVFRQEGDQGGSMLDQQLAKALYSNGQRSTRDKIVQVTLAVKLDATYSKPRILEMYAQSVYFGHGFYSPTESASIAHESWHLSLSPGQAEPAPGCLA